ncbi:MAG: exosortase-dependent surface protein XDP1 [Azoarcus sp.]
MLKNKGKLILARFLLKFGQNAEDFKMKKYTAVALLVSGLSAFSGAASAAWNWDLSCGDFACSQTVSDSQTSNPVGGPSVTVTGWSASNSGSSLSQGYIESWNGVGVHYSDESTASPNHAMDNNGRFESVLLNFGADIQLDSVGLGWVYNNDRRRSDFFVLAYTGSAVFSGDLTGKSYSDLLSLGSGWTLVGNSGGSGTGDYTLSAGSTYSSFWLIGAGAVSGTSVGYGSNNSYNDYMKVASVGGSVKPPSHDNNVPEPGSLALAGLGVLGLVGMRRRKSGR